MATRVSGDGCSSDCKTVEPGWQCRVLASVQSGLGDGVITAGEICDDGNTASGDGCSAIANWRWASSAPAAQGKRAFVTPPVCGDGKVEGSEACDDATPCQTTVARQTCRFEPNCSSATGTCTSKCGDGLVVSEACDDGNTSNGDGCSSTCKVEPGFQCAQPDSTADTMTCRSPTATSSWVAIFTRPMSRVATMRLPAWSRARSTAMASRSTPAWAAAAPTTAGWVTTAASFHNWYRGRAGNQHHLRVEDPSAQQRQWRLCELVERQPRVDVLFQCSLVFGRKPAPTATLRRTSTTVQCIVLPRVHPGAPATQVPAWPTRRWSLATALLPSRQTCRA